MQAAKPIKLDLRPNIDLKIKPFPFPRPPIQLLAILGMQRVPGKGRERFDLLLALEWRNTGRDPLPGWDAMLRFEFAKEGADVSPAYAVAPLPALAPNTDGRLEVSIQVDRPPLGVWVYHPLAT